MLSINKETFQKYMECLLEIGVLILVHKSECVTPVLIITKKEAIVRFKMYYIFLKKLVAHNPCVLPRIGDTIQKLDILHFVEALDLKLVHYTI